MANHVLMFPFHTQGHLPPMLELAELLSSHNIHITFIDNNFYSFPVHTPQPLEHYSSLPNFRFLTLDLPREELPRSFAELIGKEEARRATIKEEYRRALGPLHGWPRVTSVVADGFVSLALDVPEELRIPIFIFHVTSAAGVWFYYSIPNFLRCNEFPFQDGCDMEMEVDGVPGAEGTLRRRDLMSFVREAKSADDQVLQYMSAIGKNSSRAKALIFNVLEALESSILTHIRSVFPTVYAVCPLHRLRDQRHDLVVRAGNRTCLAWLDTRRDKSVVYASFGSTTRMSKDQLLEFWHGLADSGHPFLWVVSTDLLVQEEEPVSMTAPKATQPSGPVQLMEATKERGCIVEWAPQKEVLRHPSVGCFVTHCGTNSVMESVEAGVPMICWPFIAEQEMNSRFITDVWKIGVDMRGEMRRGAVEKAVREVMDGGARADQMKRTVAGLAESVDRSVEDGGSCSQDFKALVRHIFSFAQA